MRASDPASTTRMAARRARLPLCLAAALVLLAGCTPYQLRSILDGPRGMALRIDPASTVVPALGSVIFSADGGVPPYVFSTLSGGGTLDPDTGAYTAPATTGSSVIRVTDAAGRSADATVNIQAFSSALALTPITISLGIGSNVTFTAIGGTPPYSFTWAVPPGTGSAQLTPDPDPNSGICLYETGAAAGMDRVMVTDSTPSSVIATITVSYLPSTVDYTIPATSFPASGTVGTPVPAGTFTLMNSGLGDGTQPVTWKLYLSPNPALDSGDTLIGTGSASPLAAGASALIGISGAFPVVPDGGYYLLAEVSAADNTPSANDVSGATAVTLDPPDVDYVVTASSPASTGGTTAGAAMSGTFTLQNAGSAAGTATAHWAVYASVDTTLGGDYLLARGSLAGMPPVSSNPIPFTGTWPSTPDTWYLIATVSADDDIDPSTASNSEYGATVTAIGPAPASVEYTVTGVSNTGGLAAGDPLSGSFTYRNNGIDAAAATVYWTAYLSSNNTLEIGTDSVIDSGSLPPLAALTTSGANSFGGVWPSPDGTWFLIVAVSASDDTAPGNNATPTGSSISTSPPNVNYTAVSVSNTGATTAGGLFAGSFVIQNIGPHDGTQFVPWTVYLSEGNNLLDLGTDLVVAMGSLASPGLATGGSSGSIPFAGTWPGAAVATTWYYIVQVGAGDDVAPGNNVVPSPVGITVNPPDVRYSVAGVTSTGGAIAGAALSGEFTIANAGTAGGSHAISWTAYRSSDTIYQFTDQAIDSGTTAAIAAGGGSGPITFSGTWPSGGGSWHLIVRIAAADDTTGADNEASTAAAVALTILAPDYAITAVPLPAGSTAGQAVTGNFTIMNSGGLAGSSPVTWSVYASLGNNSYDTGDTLLDTGSIAALGASAGTSPVYAGAWPPATGSYYIVVRATTADDPSIGNAASSLSVTVTNPPPPDYTVSFAAAMPWSGLAGTALGLTGTCQLTIQNLNANPGSRSITWSVHLSTDNVLDAGDTLVQQGSTGPLAASGSTVVGYAGNWPAPPGAFYTLIASVHSSDDGNPFNDVVPAPHVCAVGDYRYKEGAEDNSGVGPKPNAANDTRTSDTGLNSAPYLSTGTTLAIEGVMDAYGQYDTYKLTTAGAMTLSTGARWTTGEDDLDFHVWDNVTTTDIVSQSVGVDSEPGAGWYNVTIPSGRPCYIGVSMYLAGNTSGSTGKSYVILVRGLP